MGIVVSDVEPYTLVDWRHDATQEEPEEVICASNKVRLQEREPQKTFTFAHNGAELHLVLGHPLCKGGVAGDIVDYHDAVRG